jgi:hypothetical protein
MEYRLVSITKIEQYSYLLTFISGIRIVQSLVGSLDTYIIGDMYKIVMSYPIPIKNKEPEIE